MRIFTFLRHKQGTPYLVVYPRELLTILRIVPKLEPERIADHRIAALSSHLVSCSLLPSMMALARFELLEGLVMDAVLLLPSLVLAKTYAITEIRLQCVSNFIA
jgi:hypothetical protein